MVTAADTQLQEAQARLLQKRATLNLTGNRGQQIESIDFQEIADRCKSIPQPDYFEKKEKLDGILQGVPRAYNQCGFDSFKGNEKLVADMKELALQRRSMVLRGNTGCGKTHLAIAVAKNTATRDQRCRGGAYVPGAIFTTAPELLLKIRSSFRDDSIESEEYVIDYHTACELLVLDDLGAEKTSEFAITTLYLILDRRIREDKQTVITTNLTPEEIEQTFGSRIASRLSAMENIKINMPDYRKKRG